MMLRRLCGLLIGAVVATSAGAASVDFLVNNSGTNYDYGRQLTLPAGFGVTEFTFELWIRPNSSFPFGPTAGGLEQRTNWTDTDNAPYSSDTWWYAGNFLLDGHNNSGYQGTFSLQFYGRGRVRWLFNDGSSGRGGVWSVGASPATSGPNVVDGQWHHLTLVRRWSGASAADLELWVDGVLIDVETTALRTNMQNTYWNGWSGFPQPGWFWGAEKQAALGAFQYEDYKGLVDEMRFWSRAKSAAEISANWSRTVIGNETGLVGWYRFGEGSGASSCDSITPTSCISFVNTSPSTLWSMTEPPLTSTGDTTAPSIPGNLQATAVSSSRVDLTWSASTDNVGVSSYRVQRDGTTVPNGAAVTGTGFSDTALAPSTTYSYTVSAVDASGNRSGESTAVQVTTPAGLPDSTAPTVPANLQGTAASSTQVNLTWNASTDNVAVASYRVQRDGVTVASGAALTTTSFNDTGLAANTTYSYTVSAVDAAGNRSGESAVRQVTTPSAPPPPPPQSGGGGGGALGSWTLLCLGLCALLLRIRRRDGILARRA